MAKKQSGLYHALVIIPDRVYPFQNLVGGELVRGIRSYNAALARYERKYGKGHYGFKLGAYRQLFHLGGSVLFLVLAAALSEEFLGGSEALYVLLVAAVLLISFQEFYLHRRMYEQLWRKGIVDWLAWCLPMGMYIISHLR